MIPGKKIQNFITFQTKDTIFLKRNQPQFIVHQQTIETDSFKQLLSTKRSKHKNHFYNPFNSEKENQEINEPLKCEQVKKSHLASSNSRNTSKQRSLSSKYKNRIFNEKIKDQVKEFDINEKENTKRSKSNKNKLSKKTKSMIRLPKYSDKHHIEQDKSKICRKSYSPKRNYSEGLKKTNPNNYSTQCIKTTKFTESKDTTTKQHHKSTKNDKNLNKDLNEQHKTKHTKSKQKLKSHFTSLRNLNDAKNLEMQRRKQQAFCKTDVEKNKKIQKKQSPTKKIEPSKKKNEQKINKIIKEKQIPKKRKSMSKSKKNTHFQSVDDILLRQQNYETTRNETTGLSNYLSQRDSFKKKVKTDRDSFNPKPKKKKDSVSKEKEKQIIVSYIKSKNMKTLRNQAAIKIQKVYKGYITRKWLRQYLKTLYAAVIIQKHWKGYLARQKVKQLISESKDNKFFENDKKRVRVDPIIEQQKSRELQFEDSKINLEKWKDILFEVMEQKTVNEALKYKIKHFLQTQNQSGRASFVSQRSQKSRNSEQKLQEEMMSQKRYFQKRQKLQKLSSSQKKHKKYNSQDSFSVVQENDLIQIQSPSLRKSFVRQSQLLSPESLPISPKLRRSQSPQQIISNLKQIQNVQKRNIILDAQSQKKELQEMLQKSVFSPRSYEIKEKQIEQKMEESLRNFEQNIKGVIQCCKDTSHLGVRIVESGSFDDDSLMMTPQHSSVRQSLVREDFEYLSQNQVMSKLFEKVENQSNVEDMIAENERQKQIEFRNAKSIKIEVSPSEQQVPTYENFQTFNVNALSEQKSQAPKVQFTQKLKKIDTSCHFLDQYLLTMIEYLRNKNDGKVMIDVVRGIRTWRNLEPYVVLRNLSVVNDENNSDDDGFSLPLYKYLEDDTEIIKSEYVMDYNKYFNMMKDSHKFQPIKHKSREEDKENQPYEHYLKLLVDSFNEALNLKRPCKYMFTDRSIESFNNQIMVERDDIDLESEYDMHCAGAMQQIFTWLNIKYGCRVTADEEETSLQQVALQDAERLKLMIKMQAEKKWDEYYEKIETLAKIGQEIFEELIIKQTITILNIERKFMREREVLR